MINSRNPGAVEVGDTFLFCEATGTELDAVLLSISIMAANMADRGGRILPVNTIYPYDTPRGREIQCPLDMTESVDVDLDDLRRVIGGGIDNGSVEGALAAMGYRDIVLDRTRVRARPAPYRDDILHPVDLIEDVIVAVGFDNFEPEMPHDFTVGKSAPDEDLADRIRGLMVGCGFQELFLPILSSSVDLTERMRSADAAIVEISNPMSENYSAVRNAPAARAAPGGGGQPKSPSIPTTSSKWARSPSLRRTTSMAPVPKFDSPRWKPTPKPISRGFRATSSAGLLPRI